MTRALCGLLPEELDRWMSDAGQPSFRADQVLRWVHRQKVDLPAQMTNLPASLRATLSREFPGAVAEVAEIATSRDGTRKLLIELKAGGSIETVLIPEEKKLTQCISTQVGCAFRCRFCLSGAKGLSRSLGADEIMAQLLLAQGAMNPEERLSNVVLMGSGEPLANYEETRRALVLLTSPRAMDLSTRRVTLSTIGLPKGIRKLGEDFGGAIGLAVSLHGPDDATRAKLMPRLKAVPIDAVLDALRVYPLPKRRRITIEYVLVRGINDAPRQARDLSRRLGRLPVKINLIPFNSHHACDLEAPAPRAVEAFGRVLIDGGLTAIRRRERGADIGAACGQLIGGVATKSG